VHAEPFSSARQQKSIDFTSSSGRIIMARSRSSRLIRVAAVLLIAVLVFGAGISSVSAAKSGAIISGNLPVSINKPTPVSTAIPTPVNVAVNGAAPVNTSDGNPVANTGDSSASGNSSATTSSYGTVSVTVKVCPTNYNTFYAINDFNKAMTDCTGAPHDVPIHLITDAGDERVLVNGRITWHNVVTGKMYIKGEDDATAIQPFTWCLVTGNTDYIEGVIVDDSLEYVMLPNKTLNCLWFVTPMHHFPVTGVTAPVNGGVMAPPESGSPVAENGTLTLNASSACPAGFDASSADIYGLAANCEDDAPAHTLTIIDSVGAEKSSQDGIAAFGSVASGSLTAWIQLPSGWASPRVFCKTQQGEAEQEAAVNGSSWTVNIVPGQDAYCDVINVPAAAQNGATVVSDANACFDAQLNGDYSHANLASNCFPDPNVTITAIEGNQLIGQASTANGTATISGIPAGTVTLQSDSLGTGLDTIHVLVYCNVSGVGNDQLVNSAGGAINLNVNDGETTNCSWFFVHPGDSAAG
jgi:hypothetical protein